MFISRKDAGFKDDIIGILNRNPRAGVSASCPVTGYSTHQAALVMGKMRACRIQVWQQVKCGTKVRGTTCILPTCIVITKGIAGAVGGQSV